MSNDNSIIVLMLQVNLNIRNVGFSAYNARWGRCRQSGQKRNQLPSSGAGQNYNEKLSRRRCCQPGVPLSHH